MHYFSYLALRTNLVGGCGVGVALNGRCGCVWLGFGLTAIHLLCAKKWP